MKPKELEAIKRRYADEWVCINKESGEVVAHGRTLFMVVDEARAKGFEVPHVTFVEPETDSVKIGL